jgi:hypothetical protein
MRPRRLYYEPETKKPYYIIDKKKVYVKVPKGVSMKQLQKVNIKNIISLPRARRVKRRRKRVKAEFEKKLVPTSMIKSDTTLGGLPTYLFQEKKEIPNLAIAGRKQPELTLVPSSTKFREPDDYMEFRKDLLKDRTDLNLFRRLSRAENTARIMKRAFEISRKGTVIIPGADDEEPSVLFTPPPNQKLLSEFPATISPPVPSPPAPKPKNLRSIVQENRMREKEAEQRRNLMPSLRTAREESKVPSSFTRTEIGKGMADDEGLYNDQIETITRKRLKRFVPCIPADKTEDLMKYVRRGDKEFAFVINTNPSESDGSGNDGYRAGHWTCVYFDNRDDYPSAEFYDPLAEGKQPVAVVKIMRRIARKMNPEKMFKYKQNMIRRQSHSSSYCGQHCIKFIEDRMNGESFCDASGYDDYIKKNQGADNSEDGERELSKYIPKYNSYV